MDQSSPGYVAAQALVDCGVTALFTLVGGHTTPIVDACPDVGLRLIDVRHEEAAAHMAHGYARATGGTGVLLVTAGPCLTNTVSGVAHAYAGGAPLLVIGGRAPLAQHDRGAIRGHSGSNARIEIAQSLSQNGKILFDRESIIGELAAGVPHDHVRSTDTFAENESLACV